MNVHVWFPIKLYAQIHFRNDRVRPSKIYSSIKVARKLAKMVKINCFYNSGN
jgi:hypothetical protein